jgi:hypothetical protein
MRENELIKKSGLTFKELDALANNAVKAIKKSYSYLGSLTGDDLYSTAWLGIMSALSQERFKEVINKKGYCYSFAKGYCSHALHRKSRMVRVPYSVIQQRIPTAHLSYSWENLPEPSDELEPKPFSDELMRLADSIPVRDQTRILAGKLPKSPETFNILKQIHQERLD